MRDNHPFYALVTPQRTADVDGVMFYAYHRPGGMGIAMLTEDHRVEIVQAYRGTTYMVRVDGKHIGSGYRDFESAARAGIKEIAA